MIKTLKLLFLIYIFSINAYAHLYFTKKENQYLKSNIIKVAMLPDFPPFSIYENGKLSGYSYDILELISKKSGLNFQYEVDKWPINIKKFKDKKVDIIDAISFRESRLDFTNYTKPYYELPLVIFSRKDLTSYLGLESLKGKKLGITKNIFYQKQIEDLGIFDIVETKSFEDKLKALAFGEVDVIFGHLLSTQIAINKSQYTNMKVLDELNLPNLKKTDLRFGIDKENSTLLSIIKKTFDDISLEEWRALHNKWISIYTKDIKPYVISNIELTEKESLFISQNKINCVMTNLWAPLYFSKDNKNIGIAYDYWDLIKNKTSINSECKIVDTFEEVLNLIKEKKADITLATAINDEKVKYANFSNSYLSFPIVIATTLDKRYISETASLNGKKVAIVKSHSAYKIIKEKYPAIDFIEVKNDFEGFKLLSKGEVYAVIDILPVLSQLILDYGFKNLKISGTTEFTYDVRMMVRDDYKDLVSVINKGILSISDEEKLEIKNKWLSVKVENIDYYTLWQIGLIIVVILLVLFYRQYILNRHNNKLRKANKIIELKTLELQNKSKQLEKQKQLFEKIYNESSDGILLTKLRSEIVSDCNKVAYELLGYANKEEFMALSPKDVLPVKQPDGSFSLDIIFNKIDDAIKNGSNQFELVHKKKDKSEVWLEVVITSIVLNNEDFLHIVWRDIQNRKNMENKLHILTHKLEEKVEKEVKKNQEKTKQLIQQNRLAQMGEMISMIAHQWRQPLTAISATTNNLLIKMMLDTKIEKEELENEITLISDYSQHLSLTIDDFRNFFKTDREKINNKLENVIENTISIVKNSLDSYDIKLLTDYKCNKELYIYSTELSQVILNIIKNAEDALHENQILNPEIKINTFCTAKNAVITIADNAIGISEDNLEKVFDPYFSTKKSKDGTGIGLYMSKIIINDHFDGDLSVSNGKIGAIFKIEIPLN